MRLCGSGACQVVDGGRSSPCPGGTLYFAIGYFSSNWVDAGAFYAEHLNVENTYTRTGACWECAAQIGRQKPTFPCEIRLVIDVGSLKIYHWLKEGWIKRPKMNQNNCKNSRGTLLLRFGSEYCSILRGLFWFIYLYFKPANEQRGWSQIWGETVSLRGVSLRCTSQNNTRTLHCSDWKTDQKSKTVRELPDNYTPANTLQTTQPWKERYKATTSSNHPRLTDRIWRELNAWCERAGAVKMIRCCVLELHSLYAPSEA